MERLEIQTMLADDGQIPGGWNAPHDFKMRKNKDTILLAKIRRYIRQAIDWYKVDDGSPEFYTTENYKYTRIAHKDKNGYVVGNYPYYVRSNRAIEEIAIKIKKLMDDNGT